LAPKAGTVAQIDLVNTLPNNAGLIVGMKVSGSFQAIYKFLTLLENSPYELDFLSMDMHKLTIEEVPSKNAKNSKKNQLNLARTNTAPNLNQRVTVFAVDHHQHNNNININARKHNNNPNFDKEQGRHWSLSARAHFGNNPNFDKEQGHRKMLAPLAFKNNAFRVFILCCQQNSNFFLIKKN